jgi:kumamolisin
MYYTLHITDDALSLQDFHDVIECFLLEGWDVVPLRSDPSRVVGSLRLKPSAQDALVPLYVDTTDDIFLIQHHDEDEDALGGRNEPSLCLESRQAEPAASIGPYFYANKMSSIYQLSTPPAVLSKGGRVNIAIISLGGGFKSSDLKRYWASENLGATTPSVYSVSVGGATNSPGHSADIENLLDIQVAGSVCPYSNIYVFFAPNSEKGFYDAVYAAVYNAVPFSVISISWGAPEVYWPSASIKAMNNLFQAAAAKGITVCVAAGDNGSSDGTSTINVDFPASSPFVLSCGGTRLVCPTNVYSSSSTRETTWGGNNTHGATGGGFSRIFPRPSYQTAATASTSAAPTSGRGRGVPDVSGNADPLTGWIIAARSTRSTGASASSSSNSTIVKARV